MATHIAYEDKSTKGPENTAEEKSTGKKRWPNFLRKFRWDKSRSKVKAKSEYQREEYDFTWEDEDVAKPSEHQSYRFSYAARDMQNYRHDYPGLNAHLCGPMHNLAFYHGEIPSAPDGVYIQEFHCEWKGQYRRLESTHSYIQWLFPLQEAGMNRRAKRLTKNEIQEFLTSVVAKRNLLESYKLMLDFYGICLSNEETGEVERAVNWRERFNNLDRNTHNNLRITRILKCLGTLGYSHYQAPLVHFFLQETLVHGNLPNVKESVLDYFMYAVIDKVERQALIRFAYLNYDHREEFVWCPKAKQMRWLEEAGESSMCKSTK